MSKPKQCTEARNREDCTCSYEPCARKGLCCDCLRYHWRKGQLPGCLFPPDVERTLDRSVERFVRLYETRGRWW